VWSVDVVLGNDVLFKCTIPSIAQDFVSVDGWVDSEGGEIARGRQGT